MNELIAIKIIYIPLSESFQRFLVLSYFHNVVFIGKAFQPFDLHCGVFKSTSDSYCTTFMIISVRKT